MILKNASQPNIIITPHAAWQSIEQGCWLDNERILNAPIASKKLLSYMPKGFVDPKSYFAVYDDCFWLVFRKSSDGLVLTTVLELARRDLRVHKEHRSGMSVRQLYDFLFDTKHGKGEK